MRLWRLHAREAVNVWSVLVEGSGNVELPFYMERCGAAFPQLVILGHRGDFYAAQLSVCAYLRILRQHLGGVLGSSAPC